MTEQPLFHRPWQQPSRKTTGADTPPPAGGDGRTRLATMAALLAVLLAGVWQQAQAAAAAHASAQAPGTLPEGVGPPQPELQKPPGDLPGKDDPEILEV